MLREALDHQGRGAAILKRTLRHKLELGSAHLPVISFDASPWGGGGILWVEGIAKQFTHFTWQPSTLKVLRVQRVDSSDQSTFEFATLLLVSICFEAVLSSTGALIKGEHQRPQ